MKKNKYVYFFWALTVIVWITSLSQVYAVECSQHDYKARVAKYADADNDGLCEYTCIYCGDSYTEVIPRTGHHYGEWQMEIEASCATQGRKYRECVDCGITEYEIIPFASSHDFGEWKTVKQPDCQSAGVRQRICKECSESQEEEVGEIASHEYEEVNQSATCTEDGVIQLVCICCGNVADAEVIPALGHQYGAESIKREPTEEAEGVAWQVCEHDETHILERRIPRLEKATEPETEPPTEVMTEAVSETETESETEVQEEVTEITPADATVAGVNVVTFGVFFFLIKNNIAVLRWARSNRRLMLERGEWK